MKCKSIVYKFNNEWLNRVDLKYSFASKFNSKTGFYLRTNVIKNGKETEEEPFMASFPHLIDVGVMVTVFMMKVDYVLKLVLSVIKVV